MKLPVHDENSPLRSADEVRAMAVVVQANLALLRRVDCKRRSVNPDQHDIQVTPPTRVIAYKDALIPPTVVQSYSDLELHLRLHEVWGQYCAMRWLFQIGDHFVDFSKLSNARELECAAAIGVKLAEVHAFLWKFRFEQKRRERSPGSSPDSAQVELAQSIPAAAFDKPAERLADDELLFAACQHAGMLAVLRWVSDARRKWDEPGIMDVADSPFEAPP